MLVMGAKSSICFWASLVRKKERKKYIPVRKKERKKYIPVEKKERKKYNIPVDIQMLEHEVYGGPPLLARRFGFESEL